MPGLTIENLDQIAQEAEREFLSFRAMLMVCGGTGCVSSGALSIRDALQKEIEQQGLGPAVKVVATGCNGFCAHGPICVVQPQGVFYQRLKIRDVKELIEQHFGQDQPVERLMYRADRDGPPIPLEKDIQFFAKQQAIALRNRGLVDPEDIRDAIRRGAYRGLKKVLSESQDGESIINTVIRSGIRGRGGGGFPTGVKWKSCFEAARRRGERPYVVCNADEGDPGAFMDRSIVEADPHAVIEGLLIGARALGAEEGFVYIRREYPLALRRLQKAIEQAREWGVLGPGVMGSDMCFDIVIHQGAGAFVCGESTALMASMEGRPGEPRAKYVHTVESGYRDKPTVLNNVETWANIPQIVEKGAEWFASIGTGDVSESPWGGSSGTKVFSLVGNVNNTGLVEVPMGITLREIVFDIGGGIPGGKKFKAVQTGGPSGGCLPESQLDMPVDFDTLTQAGSMMGSGGLIVMDENTCMVDVARYFVSFLLDESCGKCTPCREGLITLNEILTRITEGKGGDEDLRLIEEIGAAMRDGSLCGLGQTAANPVLSTLRYFREDGEVETPHVIDQDKCIQCGTCLDACNFDAVLVE
jgi:NADH:ubiquinone oxidoreductase subunit F (NADH-binding)/(2Fe-2S) ferredoxin